MADSTPTWPNPMLRVKFNQFKVRLCGNVETADLTCVEVDAEADAMVLSPDWDEPKVALADAAVAWVAPKVAATSLLDEVAGSTGAGATLDEATSIGAALDDDGSGAGAGAGAGDDDGEGAAGAEAGALKPILFRVGTKSVIAQKYLEQKERRTRCDWRRKWRPTQWCCRRRPRNRK